MVYKWCVVPQCLSTSIKTPEKLFLSVPTNPKRRKTWLQMARRDPNSILPHTNVFMCEDHFDMEKVVSNYMKYKMGFSQNLRLTNEAVPTKFHCQGDRKRGLSDAGPSRDVSLKRQRVDLVTECLRDDKTLLKDVDDSCAIQETNEPEEIPKTQNKETLTDPIVTSDKSVQVTSKGNLHYRSKAVQTRCQNKDIFTSPLRVSTVSRFTSPFKIEPCYLQPSHSGTIKAVKRKALKMKNQIVIFLV